MVIHNQILSPDSMTKVMKLPWENWMEDTDRWIDEIVDKDLDLEYQNEELQETKEAPPDLLIPLVRYQKEWLAWALKQETSEYEGGILADEMGMGKTIQAIALVLAKWARNQTGFGSNSSTLVICPVVGVTQWEDEIANSTPNGSARVFVFHGSKRNECRDNLSKYDFVLTTYQTLAMDYKKSMIPSKKEDQGSPTEESILHSVKWNRIILDEAQYIKNRSSNSMKAVLALESSYKWALTATPFQNNVGELYSLVCFLRVYPYAYRFCMICECEVLDRDAFHQRKNSHCSKCGHGFHKHFNWWYKYVSAPIQNSKVAETRRRALILLKHKIFKSLMLRRTKKGRAADLFLPPKTVILRVDKLDNREKDYYETLKRDIQLQYNAYVEAGILISHSAFFCNSFTRLRQEVNHPYLVIYSKGTTLTSRSNVENDEECGICHDPAEDPVVTSCEHVFCKVCLTEYFKVGRMSCVSCSKPLSADVEAKMKQGDQGIKTSIKGFQCSSIINSIKNLEKFHSSTKIDALKEEIRFMIERDVCAKGIVFSQFVQFLDLIHYSLQKSGINCVKLMGGMTRTARDSARKTFTDDPDCKIFLLCLKSGGVALNLTAASHVFLMEPCWNPAMERQAQDRIHRIGQDKSIRVVKFTIQNTIEERILELQMKKEGVFEGSTGDSLEALVTLANACFSSNCEMRQNDN